MKRKGGFRKKISPTLHPDEDKQKEVAKNSLRLDR
jgi:hypothetical protein